MIGKHITGFTGFRDHNNVDVFPSGRKVFWYVTFIYSEDLRVVWSKRAKCTVPLRDVVVH